MYNSGNSAEKAYLEMKARGPLAHCLQIRKKSSNRSKYHYRVYVWLQEGIFTVFTIMGNIPDPKDWLLIGIGLSSEDHIFSFFSDFSRVFLSFCSEKVIWFYSLFSSKFYDHFDVHFHDQIVTRRQIIYGHTWGIDQQKYFFERLHCKFRRKIGQIDSQTPKRERNPKK